MTAGHDRGEESTAQRLARGDAVRRRVVGASHVDREGAATSPHRQAFERYLTGAAWADVWDDGQLEQPVRSLVTVCLLAAGGHARQLEVHLRAARDAGIPAETLAAGLMHVAIYAGLPAANLGIATLDRVYAQADPTDDAVEAAATGDTLSTTEQRGSHEQ